MVACLRGTFQNLANTLKWIPEYVNPLGASRHPVAIIGTNCLFVTYSKSWKCNHHLTAMMVPSSKRHFATAIRNYSTIKYCGSNIYGWKKRTPRVAVSIRDYSTSQWSASNKQTLTYVIALAITVVGLSYAAVPLYRIYCQASGYGGTVTKTDPSEKIEQMEPIEERELTIRFNADRNAGMRWTFKPQQREIKLVPGETALAFYTATNPTDSPITGIATYNVIPFDAGQYFNKIQCFCFEEQRLNPHEEVDMPVFFYIDPEFAVDPSMAKVDSITLSYTFFEAKDGETINIPIPTL